MTADNTTIFLRLSLAILLFVAFPAWSAYRLWKKGEKGWAKVTVVSIFLGLGLLAGINALFPQKFRGLTSLLMIYALGYIFILNNTTEYSPQELAVICIIPGVAVGILWFVFINSIGRATKLQKASQTTQNQNVLPTGQGPGNQPSLVQNEQKKYEPVLARPSSHTPVQKTIREPHPVAKMKFFEVPCPSGWQARCSDDECPCGSPGTPIARGSGYLYISRDVVEFRKDALSLDEAEEKLESVRRRSGFNFIVGIEKMAVPILICDLGARRRGLDLEAAAADAKYWWETELVPLRPTPLLGSYR